MPRKPNKTRSKLFGNSCESLTPKTAKSSDFFKTVRESSKLENEAQKLHVSGTRTTTEQVCHRKSERRRVARDIFLVFEEQPKNYGKTRGSNKKQAKPKFGHLNVGEPVKTKSLLRDIKNEPKCCLLKGNTNTLHSKRGEKKTILEKNTNQLYDLWSSTSCPPVKSIYPKIEAINSYLDTDRKNSIDETSIVARVNPIFLWAKQDNTRIIEVRCEDYDRRNRIRITKTSNGWRAMPRSDPTSTKILKFYTSPLIKVKRENVNIIPKNISHPPPAPFSNQNNPNSNSLHSNGIQGKEENSQIENPFNRSKRKARKKKSKKRKENNCREVLTNSSPIDNKVTSVSEEAYKDNYKSNDYNRCIGNSDQKTSTLKQNSSPHLFALKKKDNVGDDYTFQLCPKTGIFLRFHKTYEHEECNIIENFECNIVENLDMESQIKTITQNKRDSIEENTESLEAKTRNLKDLLDDADLFQHCSDNVDNDSDLIETLVKSSCESNLLHDSETCIKESFGPRLNKDVNDVPKEIEDMAQIINDVSEPPKCLSFNEAGEIEALNCDLFQSNTYIEPFEKQAVVPSNSVSEIAANANDSNSLELENTDKSKFCNITVSDDSPKDLSYKKREEVCPPSESRSQCAVTSSSDIIKSPNIDESSVLASSSETLKSLIFEQFMKLSSISKQKKNHPEAIKLSETSQLSQPVFPKSIGANLNEIQTYIIDDDDVALEDLPSEDIDGPLKKRLRSATAVAKNTADIDKTMKAKMAMIDKDPDPLTQLRLLIQNSQWKVPDPILVPKDRLSAVLASPAREIPLLITTRPELRLPEAFAYPEIIQNPNILVISMAQLEAILKNNQEVCKTGAGLITMNEKQRKNSKININDSTNSTHQSKQLPIVADIQTRDKNFVSAIPKDTNVNTNLSNNSVISSDLNAATMAILNQMLWIPYFGKISRDMKSIKAASNIDEKITAILPHEPQNLEHIIEKNEQSTSSSASVNNKGLNENLNSMLYKDSQIDRFALFNKVLQQQMQNVINLNLSKYTDTKNTSDRSALQKNDLVECTVFNGIANRNASNIGSGFSNNKNTQHNVSNSVETGKTYNLRSSVGSRYNSGNNHITNINRSNLSNKPRVTCKSLSNLLEPDLNQPQPVTLNSSNTLPTVPIVDKNFMHDVNGQRNHTSSEKTSCRFVDQDKDSKIKSFAKSGFPKHDIFNEFNKQSYKIVQDTIESGVRNADPSPLSTESNVPLWHPLFGSNSKSAYSSPWQWTTVTTAGE